MSKLIRLWSSFDEYFELASAELAETMGQFIRRERVVEISHDGEVSMIAMMPQDLVHNCNGFLLVAGMVEESYNA